MSITTHEMKCFKLFWYACLKFPLETVNIDNDLFRVFSLYVISFVPTLSSLCLLINYDCMDLILC